MVSFLLQAMVHAIKITGFVAMMMLASECPNIMSQGVWHRHLRGGIWRHYYPRHINYMPAVKFVERLDLKEKFLFLDGH